jgi:predicted P-loop ATPase
MSTVTPLETNNISNNSITDLPAAQAANDEHVRPKHIEGMELIEAPERAYLTSRGVDLRVAAKFGLRTVATEEQPWVPELFGLKGWKKPPCKCLAIPYPCSKEFLGRAFYRLRLRETVRVIDHSDEAREDEVKHYPKFLAPSGVGTIPYIVGRPKDYKNTSVPVYVFEGPVKALSWASTLWKQGVYIGLGGVEAGAHDTELRKDTGLLRPHPMLTELLTWEGRTVYIAMDAGRVLNPNVARGEAKTVQLFQEMGAKVIVLKVPLHEGKDQGPDDWLARQGDSGERRREAIQRLTDAADPGDLVERAKLVESTDEARRLLADLPFQAALALNENAVVGLILKHLKTFGIDKAAIKDAIVKFRITAKAKSKKDDPPWKSKLTKSSSGQTVASVANVMDVLRNDERLVGVLGYDEFAERPMIRKPLPWERYGRDRPLTDADIIRLAEWLEREHRLRIGPTMLHPVVHTRCREIGYHPIQEYLGRPVWDRIERVQGKERPGWLTTYFGAEDTPYVRLVGKVWLVSAVARVEKPGCKADGVLILEGKQGRKKSSGLRALVGDAWFSDSLSDLGTKDSYVELLGKWIIEMSELEALSRAEATEAKRYTTKQTDFYREPYGRLPRDVPRQCVFCGTTNAAEYLKDWTGGRRFWPVVITKVDIEALRRDRDQLWAEARALYRDGERWWVETDEEVALCESEQEVRRIQLPYEDEIVELLDGLDAVTVKSIVTKLTDSPTERRSIEPTVGKVLHRLGWTQGRKQIEGVRSRYYVRPEKDGLPPTDDEVKAALVGTPAAEPVAADIVMEEALLDLV